MNKYQVEIGEESVTLMEGANLGEVLEAALESNNLNTQRLIFVGVMSMLVEVEDSRANKVQLRIVQQSGRASSHSRFRSGIRRVNGRLGSKLTVVTDGATVDVWATNSGGRIGHFDERGVQLYAYVRGGQGALIANIQHKPTYDDWIAFCDCIETTHEINIPRGFVPYWLSN